jgi:hypothetical protein
MSRKVLISGATGDTGRVAVTESKERLVAARNGDGYSRYGSFHYGVEITTDGSSVKQNSRC